MVGEGRVEIFGPSLDGGEDLVGVAFAEFLARLMAVPGFGAGELGDECGEGLADEWGLFDQGAAGLGDAPDAAVAVVATGVAKVVVGVVDDGVIPIGDVDGAVGPHLDIDGAEVWVLGLDEGLEDVGAEAGSVFDELVAHDGAVFEAAGEKLVAEVVADVAAAREVAAALFGGADEDGDFDVLPAVAGGGGDVHDLGVVDHEGLAPVVEDVAPGIAAGAGAEDAQFAGAGVVLIDAAIEVADEAARGLDLGVEEDAFLKVEPAAGAASPGADGVMAVLDAEAGEGEFFLVGDVVSVGVLIEKDVGGLRDVAAAIGELDAGGEVEAVGEDGGFVGFAVTVGVFEDDDFVVGLLPGFELGVGPGAGDPEAAAGVPLHVNGVFD